MSEADRLFRESPIFERLGATSFSFAFELEHSDRDEPHSAAELTGEEEEIDATHRCGFRLRALGGALARLKSASEAEQRLYRELIQPVRSFLDDVTMGPPGSNGRPLLFAASGAHPNAASRGVKLVRPTSWDYEYENEVTRLAIPASRLIEFRLRDSFCAFESGRLFYLLTFTQDVAQDEDEDDPGAESRVLPAPPPQEIDEYTVLQLQQLILDKKLARRAGFLGFWTEEGEPGEGEALSLIELAERRLSALEAGKVPGTNGIRDVVEPWLIPPRPGVRRMPIGLRHLRRLCIGIESDVMVDTASRVHRRFLPPEEAAKVAAGLGGKGPAPRDLWTPWKKRCSGKPRLDPPHHHDPENPLDRTFLAFAGLAQGVPDFPYQDESEVHDSTRPAAFSVESWLYVHPSFVLEVAKRWRSFNQARPTIGTCPYLLLMFMVSLHDELVVTDMEKKIDEMVYAPGPEPRRRWWRWWLAPAEDRSTECYSVPPMRSVLDVLAGAKSMERGDVVILEANLRKRFELFRWASIQRSGNLFRYPKERGALTAIQQAMGTQARFDRAHEIVDRMEALIEDLTSLKSSYAERRTNLVLGCIALLSVLSVSTDVSGLVNEAWRLPAFFASLGLASTALLLLFLRSRRA